MHFLNFHLCRSHFDPVLMKYPRRALSRLWNSHRKKKSSTIRTLRRKEKKRKKKGLYLPLAEKPRARRRPANPVVGQTDRSTRTCAGREVPNSHEITVRNKGFDCNRDRISPSAIGPRMDSPIDPQVQCTWPRACTHAAGKLVRAPP